jgi:hypothetical protein
MTIGRRLQRRNLTVHDCQLACRKLWIFLVRGLSSSTKAYQASECCKQRWRPANHFDCSSASTSKGFSTTIRPRRSDSLYRTAVAIYACGIDPTFDHGHIFRYTPSIGPLLFGEHRHQVALCRSLLSKTAPLVLSRLSTSYAIILFVQGQGASDRLDRFSRLVPTSTRTPPNKKVRSEFSRRTVIDNNLWEARCAPP